MTPLVGRQAERHTVQASLRPGRLVMLVGAGGVGKTRLASELGRRHSGRTVFVDAAAAQEPEDLARALLRDLGSTVPLPPGGSLVQHAGTQLAASGASLCVLDDLDRLGDRAGPVLSELVQAAPQAAFLATSRAADASLPEHRIVIEPVSVEEGIELYLGALPPARALSQVDRDRIGRIVQRLGGLPLAIELASGRTAVLSLEEIERRLEQPLSLLRDPSRPPDRGSALARSVAASWELLPADTASVLAQSAVFAGSFDLDAAHAVLQAPGDLPAHLQFLVGRFLLQVDGQGRFAPYESVRAFAAEMLHLSGAEERTLERHADYHAALAARCSESERHWDTLLHVSADIDAVLARGVAAGARPEASALACGVANCLWKFLLAHREAREVQALFERLLSTDPVPAVRVEVLHNLGTFALQALRLSEAEEVLGEMLALARELGDVRHIVEALGSQVRLAGLRGDLEGAERLGKEAIVLARASGETPWLVGLLLGAVNTRARSEGRYDEVLARLDEAYPLARHTSPDSTVPMVLSMRAEIELAQGRLEQAERTLLERRALLSGRRLPRLLEKQAYLEMKLESLRGGPGSLERIRALLPQLESDPFFDAMGRSILALAVACERGPDVEQAIAQARERLEPLPSSHGMWALLRCACALAGLPAPEPPTPEPANPVMGKIELVVGLMNGTVEPEQALEAAGSGPASVVDGALREAIRRVQERRSSWTLLPHPRGLRAPDGSLVDLRSAHLVQLAQALASERGRGLDVGALFAAGWPGEKATPHAQRNRVRVAITTLRQRGLPIGWEREKGWFFAAPVASGEGGWG
jgi:predicted ATPase